MSRRVGYDDVIDYKAGALSDALVRACPRGVDVYFDYTAGPISDAVLPQLAMGARVVICGTASMPSWDPPPTGPRVERYLLVKRARMAGLLIFDYEHRYEEAVVRLAAWVRDGRLRYREDIIDGIENCPGGNCWTLSGRKPRQATYSSSRPISFGRGGRMSAFGEKRTSFLRCAMSAYDPKRTCLLRPTRFIFIRCRATCA